MKQDAYLFHLIHSLDRNEKRYFKIFAEQQKRGGNKNYLQLYDAMEGMATFSKEALQEKLSKSGLLKHLSSEKSYLWKTLLRAMRSYHSSTSGKSQLRDLIENGNLLIQKGLYIAAVKEFDKALKLAKEGSQTLSEIKIINRQIALVHYLEEKGRKARLQTLIGIKAQTLECLESSEKIFDLYNTYAGWVRTSVNLMDSMDQKEVEQLRLELNSFDNEQLNTFAQIHLIRLRFLIERWQGNMQEAYDYHATILTLWEKHPFLIKYYSAQYKIDLANHMGAAFLIGQYHEFPSILTRIKNLPSKNFDQEGEVFQNIFFYDLIWKMNTNQWKAAEELIPSIVKGLNQYAQKIHLGRVMAFQYNIAILYFIQEKWSLALTWVRRLISHPKSDHRQDLQQFGRLLELIFLLESTNYELLEFRSQTTHKYLKRWKELNAFDRLILNLVTAVIKDPGQLNEPQFWEQYRSSLEEFHTGEQSPLPLGFEEIRYWINGKVTRTPMTMLLENEALDPKSS